MFENLKTSNDIEEDGDSLGGSFLLPTSIYECVIQAAYITTSAGGAFALNLDLQPSNGQAIKQQLWMTSGTAKGGLNYYERNGKKHYLPGFNAANAIALLSVGKEIGDLDSEKKVVGIYNYTQKKEVPTEVDMIMELIGQSITLGLLQTKEDGTTKQDDGTYKPDASKKPREHNEIDKVFRTRDRLTVKEIKAQQTDPVFYDKWLKQWDGKVKDKTTVVYDPSLASNSTPGAAAKTTEPTKPLFA